MEQQNIYSAISSIMHDLDAIGKNKTNKAQGFKYRGIDDVMNALHPLMVKYGVFVVPKVLEQTREERTTKNGGNLIYSIYKIEYVFYAKDGSSVSAVTVGEGMDSSDKSGTKAMAIAFKYACFQVFCIPTADMDDPDADTPPESKPHTGAKQPDGSTNAMTPTQAASVIFNSGKYEGKTVREVYKIDCDYLDWTLNNSKNEYMKKVIKMVLDAANAAKPQQKREYEAFMQVDIDDSELPWNDDILPM